MDTGYWLFKSEPGEFSIKDLKDSPGQTACWDGVRNFQARNFLRDMMHRGDRVLFHHSGKDPAVVGTARVVRAGYPDHTAWDPRSRHFDPKSSPEHPVWYMVDIRFETEFPRPLPIAELRKLPELRDMVLLRRGVRLSVQPVAQKEFHTILVFASGRAAP